jgi:hypothetical protein
LIDLSAKYEWALAGALIVAFTALAMAVGFLVYGTELVASIGS